jgi:hypothetical protein
MRALTLVAGDSSKEAANRSSCSSVMISDSLTSLTAIVALVSGIECGVVVISSAAQTLNGPMPSVWAWLSSAKYAGQHKRGMTQFNL